MNKIRFLVDSTSSLTKEKADELGVTLRVRPFEE